MSMATAAAAAPPQLAAAVRRRRDSRQAGPVVLRLGDVLEQNLHLRRVDAVDRLHAGEIPRRPGAGGPIGPAEPDIAVLAHEPEHRIERRETGRTLADPEFTEEAALVVLTQPVGYRGERRHADRLALAFRMRAGIVGVEVLVQFVDIVVARIVDTEHHRGVGRAVTSLEPALTAGVTVTRHE